MNRTLVSALVLSLAGLAAGSSYAADAATTGKTRDEVRAELFEARRSGDVLADGEIGAKLNEQHPEQYARSSLDQPKTREQVLAELDQARRQGQLAGAGEFGLTVHDRTPLPAPQMAALPKTRADVRAELFEARRKGEVIANGETGATLKELNPARYSRAI